MGACYAELRPRALPGEPEQSPSGDAPGLTLVTISLFPFAGLLQGAQIDVHNPDPAQRSF